MGGIGYCFYILADTRLEETGPAAAGIIFVFGVEERLAAAAAVINTLVLAVMIFPGKRAFGTLAPGDIILFRSQPGTPLVFCLFHAVTHPVPRDQIRCRYERRHLAVFAGIRRVAP